jgi:predicted 3-demethylubiquinone-9 3-methyltransferase (glyoxalase superfamily)
MSTVTTFLTYSDKAEEAVNLYVSLIRNSRVNGAVQAPDGSYSLVFFELDGRPYTAMNGGSSFSFSSGFSLFVECEDQLEVDRIWNGLVSNGGAEGPCGWLTDPYGVSWQVIPKRFLELSGDPDRAAADRVIKAMLGMKKLIISELEAAAST